MPDAGAGLHAERWDIADVKYFRHKTWPAVAGEDPDDAPGTESEALFENMEHQGKDTFNKQKQHQMTMGRFPGSTSVQTLCI